MVTIRAMLQEDLARVSDIVCAGYRLQAEQAGYTAEQLDRLIAERGIEPALVTQLEQCRFIVAVSEEEILGVAAIAGNEITKLYIDPQFLRRGVGTALFQAAEKIIAADGNRQLSLGAFAFRVPFYEAMGMQVATEKTITGGPLAGERQTILEKSLPVS